MTMQAYSPPDEIRVFVHGLICKVGVNRATQELGLGQQTALRLAAGVPVTRGTIAQAREVMRARGGL